jgi:copper chaperone CopZ
LQDISKWLIIGMMLAALLSVVIPDDFFTKNISNEYLAMVLMLLASVPLYICATGSIPIAAVLLMKGLSPGAALVLLMAGPATNIATMAVIGNSLGRKTLWVYLASIIGGALFFGTIVNELIPREWITGAIPSVMHGAGHGHATGWFQWIMSAMLVVLIMNGYLQKWINRYRTRKEDQLKSERMKMNVHVFKVEGMTCAHCKATVENGIRGLSQVSEVVADPGQNLVSVEADTLDEESIRSTIEKLGYIYKGRV